MPDHYTKVGGVWKKSNKLYTRQGGVWKEITNGYVKQSGVWKKFYSATVPNSVATAARVTTSGGNTSWSPTNVALGTADATRFIVCCVMHGGSPTNITCKIGGITAPRLLLTGPAAGSFVDCFGLAVPTGTTANFALTSTGGNGYWGILVYAVYNLQSTTPVASYTDYWSNTAATAKSIGCNTVSGGVILSFASSVNSGTLSTLTWVNTAATGATQFGSTPSLIQGGRTDNTGADSPRIVTVTPSGTTVNVSGLSVALR